MSLDRERPEFVPPATPGLVRAVLLALLAHGVLVAILTMGIAWKRDPQAQTVEAELWSAVPQQAAAPAPPEPLPPPEAVPPPRPPEPRQPPRTEPAAPPSTAVADAAIAMAKEKARKEKEKEKERLLREKEALEKERQAKLEKERLAREKLKEARLKEERQKEDKRKAEAKQKEQQAQERDKAQAQKLQELREQNLRRMAGMAGSGGNGEPGSASTAARSSGPSASYAGRVRARIKPNITYTESPEGNPTVEIEVRTSPDGTIISKNVVKRSGSESWDKAAINAIEKTAVLPRDENGRVPGTLIIVLSPREMVGH